MAYDELRGIAEQVAWEAAGVVRAGGRGDVAVAGSKSSSVDIVTEVDRASEKFLRGRLAELRPDDGFLGEEGTHGASASGVTWVVDPIDGTVNFLYGIPQYCVSVAALDADGSPVAGAVADVVPGNLYSASSGGGATCDGVPLRVRDRVPGAERLWLTGFQYQAEIRAVQGRAVAQLLPRVRDIRRMGAAALDLCAIAAGRADAYVEEGLHLWDRAAAGLVATEAGAELRLLDGAGGTECVVCAPAHSITEVLELVAECGFLA
jgi:myo-inositol-1(or 4)-monophosphatase